MSGVAFATRRMWIRRTRRVGLLLVRVFSIVSYVLPPMWVFWFYRAWFKSWKTNNFDGIFFGSILQIGVLTFGSIVGWQSYLSRDATPTELRVARQADTCFDNTIVRRAAVWQRPVSIRDLHNTQADCELMWDNITRVQIQADILKQQLIK